MNIAECYVTIQSAHFNLVFFRHFISARGDDEDVLIEAYSDSQVDELTDPRQQFIALLANLSYIIIYYSQSFIGKILGYLVLIAVRETFVIEICGYT